MRKIDFKKLLPYLVAIVVFIGLTLIYCAPMLEGKVLQAGDVNNWKGAANEAREYKSATGETPWWTNSQFGGMPTFQITGTTPTNTVVYSVIHRIAHLGFNDVMGYIIGYFVGFFIMLLCFGINPWIALIGSIAISFSSYFFIILPAGHMTKANALGFLASMFGGFYAIFHKKYGLGFAVCTIAGICGIVLHPQMSYYMFMLIGVCCITELIIHIKEKRWKDLGIGIGVFAISLLLVFGTKISWWQMNQEYLAETMRGSHSELNQSAEDTTKKAGLDIDYATAWSYGVKETMTFLIPNFMGGASGYNVGEKSVLYEEMVDARIPRQSAKQFCQGAPTYWGEKAFTSGPVYMGAIICFLYVLGLIIVKGPYKWALLVATLFSVTLAWGRNFMPFTEFFFYHFPMYNKFRAVESILVVAEITMPLLGILAINQLIQDKAKSYQKPIYIAAGITVGICLIFALFGGGLCNFTSSYDNQWKGQVGDTIYSMIIDQRAAMLKADAWRSLLFILAAAATICIYVNGKLKNGYFYSILGILILIDMVPVDKRYFRSDQFVSPRENNRYFNMQSWEEQILQDQSLDYRVLNFATNTFNDARTSYRLKSIGGYSAAKLRRYQDLIDAHISKNNWNVMNMLNTKYLITRDGVMQNPEAFGNAWFVDSLKVVSTPDEESAALWNTDLRKTAVIDSTLQTNQNLLDICSTSGNASIELVSYKPNQLIYQSETDEDKVAVFSEIYYPHGWHLYIDGQEKEIGRANYILRASIIPAGNHEIIMKFIPDALKVDKWCMGILAIAILLSLVALWLHFSGKESIYFPLRPDQE